MKDKMSVKAELISPIKMFETPEKMRNQKRKNRKEFLENIRFFIQDGFLISAL